MKGKGAGLRGAEFYQKLSGVDPNVKLKKNTTHVHCFVIVAGYKYLVFFLPFAQGSNQ